MTGIYTIILNILNATLKNITSQITGDIFLQIQNMGIYWMNFNLAYIKNF